MNPYRRILHPTDLSPECQPAFAHALKLALAHQGSLEILYCSGEPDHPPFDRFPRVRNKLIRWGVLPEGASKQDVVDLGLDIRKQVVWGEPTEEIANESFERDAELLVMASHARGGWRRLLAQSVSTNALQQARVPGLLLPLHHSGFVNPHTGEVQLERVLIPVAPEPDSWPALVAANRMVASLRPGAGTLLQVYVGQSENFPGGRCPEASPGWGWEQKVLTGEPVTELIRFAEEWKPQLAVMASQGQDNWKDRWFGSTVEQLLGKLPCPLLVVPPQAPEPF